MPELASMPIFVARGRKSVATASIWAVTIAAGIASIIVTPSVFCAVTAVIAEVPYTRCAANVFRSA